MSGGSRGIGKGITTMLAEQGYSVAFTYNTNKIAATEVERNLSKHGCNVKAFQMTVEDRSSVKATISEIENHFLEPVQILINNAAIAQEKPFDDIRDEDWKCMLNVNLLGPFICTQEILPGMIKDNWGRIINITSIVGVKGNPGQIAYCASKAGIIGMTKTAAKELGEIGITVNAIAPGLTDTSMISHLSDNQMSKYVNQTPLGRIAEPQEIANLATFLASESAKYINGQIIRIDGGMIM